MDMKSLKGISTYLKVKTIFNLYKNMSAYKHDGYMGTCDMKMHEFRA